MPSMTQRPVRTRFAPSPTGYLHVGGARTALFNYLYARSCGGQFVLRIEDTDTERSSSQAERDILDALVWLELKFDEGPAEGGKYGPYRQSERLEGTYTPYTQKLMEGQQAYPCFCSDAELQTKQQQARILGKPYIYDGTCRNLDAKEVEVRKKAGEPYAIRFRTKSREVIVEDLVQGKVKFDTRLIGDFIIIKSNSFPSYNYAVVLDDYEMQISHVIRGVGHLSNTPRQILIHQALGLPLPHYAHISEIVGTDRKKLSKRRGATSILMFRELGYLPQAFINYMSLLGWYPRDGVEFMPKQKELIKKFDISHCSKSPAMFDFFLLKENQKQATDTTENEGVPLSLEDIQKNINKKSKLNWLNNLYLRETPLEELWPLIKKEWLNAKSNTKDETLTKLLKQEEAQVKHCFDAIRKYLNTFTDALPYLSEFFREGFSFQSREAEQFLHESDSTKVAQAFLVALEKESPKQPEEFSELMQKVGQECQCKGRSLFMPIRVATTGTMVGLELPLLFSLLGKARLSKRLKSAL